MTFLYPLTVLSPPCRSLRHPHRPHRTNLRVFNILQISSSPRQHRPRLTIHTPDPHLTNLKHVLTFPHSPFLTRSPPQFPPKLPIPSTHRLHPRRLIWCPTFSPRDRCMEGVRVTSACVYRDSPTSLSRSIRMETGMWRSARGPRVT